MITDDFLRTRVHLFGGKSLYLLPRLNTASVFPSTGLSPILIYHSSRCGWTAGTQQRCNINQYKLVSKPDVVGPFLITPPPTSRRGAVASWLKKKKRMRCVGPLTGDSCLLMLGGVPGRYLRVVRDPRGETPFGSS